MKVFIFFENIFIYLRSSRINFVFIHLDKRTLCPSTIVIIDSLLCTACRDKQCLHAKAAQLAIDDHLFQEVDAKNHAGFDIHFLTENSAILVDASTFHLFNCKVTRSY